MSDNENLQKSNLNEFFDFDAFFNTMAEEEPQSQGAGLLRRDQHAIHPPDAGSSVYANELNFEPQHLDPDFDESHEAIPLEGANSHVQQTLMGTPESLLPGSIDGSDSAATHGYLNPVTSTSYSAIQQTANPYHDTTSYAPPPIDTVREAALRKKQTGALSSSGTTPQASNVLACKDPEAGCACFLCKHRIYFDRPYRNSLICRRMIFDRDFLFGHDMIDPLWSSVGLFKIVLINSCSAPDCDRPHGFRRQAETTHLFSPQLCSGQVQYRCAVQGCHYFSIRRFELKRHHAAKHCTQPERFPCPEPYCRYGGDNGFIRPDKLKEHQKKIHEGKFKPAKALRTIKSAATKPVTE